MTSYHLIIDCGATSMKAALIDNLDVSYLKYPGFNASSPSRNKLESSLKSIGQNFRIREVDFYGAGLNSPTLVCRIKSLLSGIFGLQEDRTHVYSDILAPCHAIFKDQPVITMILGTGSNVAYYDGRLTQQTPSLGYLLGDEGSGTDLGKRLILAFFYGRLPQYVSDILAKEWHINRDLVIQSSYRDYGLRELAAPLAKVVGQYRSEPQIQHIIRSSFISFINNRLGPELEAHPEINSVHAFGSVSVSFCDELTQMVKNHAGKNVAIHESILQLLVESKLGK